MTTITWTSIPPNLLGFIFAEDVLTFVSARVADRAVSFTHTTGIIFRFSLIPKGRDSRLGCHMCLDDEHSEEAIRLASIILNDIKKQGRHAA